MRVLMVTEFYPPISGGLEFHVQNLANELAARGHEVHVATLGATSYDTREGEVVVHRIRSTTSRLSFLYSDPARPFHLPISDHAVRQHLTQLVSRLQPQVIHAHNWMAASLPRVSPPIVLTHHDYSWACPKRTFLRNDASVCEGPSLRRCMPCATPQYGRVKAVLVDSTTRIGRRRVQPDFHIAVSNAVATAISPFTRHAPVVIPNFVASALADRPSVPVGGLPQEPFALFAGAAAPHKGLDVLLEAWKPPAPCPLVIATIQPLNRSLPPDVTQTSFSRDELVSVLRSAALTVVPSLWPDPCPTIVIEAMTLGVPIVASHIGGIKELVTDGLEGRLVSPNDPGALRQAVTQLLASPSLREGMAAAGRRRSATYSLKALATSIELLYTEAIREADAIGDADA